MSRFSILVVDDDPVIRKVVTQFVEAGGYGTTAAVGGREALEIFEASPFDLVITDLQMGEMPGTDLARHLCELRPEVPVCLMTGVKDEMPGEDKAPFAVVLEKPFTEIELRRVLAALFPAAGVAGGQVRAAPRFEVDWRLDYFPLEAGSFTRENRTPQRAVLRDFSKRGLSFSTGAGPAKGRFGAFLIHPPGCESPSLMVGEIRWRKDHADGVLAGTRRMFWGSERERDQALAWIA